MLIGIDASRAVAAHPTGTEIYSQEVTRWLLALGEEHRFRLYFRRRPPAEIYGRAELRVMPFPRLWTHVRLSWEMARHAPDALFVPAHVLPIVHPRVSLVTVHDLGYLHFPAAHRALQRIYLALSTRWSARMARHLLADSEATKADLVRHCGVEPGRITVAYPGVDERLHPVDDRGAIGVAKRRCGIQGEYYLSIGTLQPRKNLARLLEAYARLAGPVPHLVLAGAPGWGFDDLQQQVMRLGLTERVIFAGYVDQADKAPLLSGATAFVFPSLYEGFGLPVLEAQACGCPVIASNTSSLPEAAGDGALLVDPADVAALADAMQRLAEDGGLRRDLTARGLANAGRFSWRACASRILGAIESCSA